MSKINELGKGRAAAEKRPGALRTIGEVSDGLGIRQHVLRYWETQFPMLQPVKRSGSRRYYRPEDIALLERIDQLVHRDGYTLRGARQLIEQDGKDEPSVPDQPLALAKESEERESLHDSLKKIREKLALALSKA